MKHNTFLFSALLIAFMISSAAFAQEKLKFHVVSFENDVFDTSAKDDRWKKIDGSGSLYAIIKVTDENTDDLKAYTFNFGNMNHFVEEHDDELWIYVQKNAKTVTITRNGYATLHRYDLQTTIGEGKTYKMVLSSQGPVVHTQMVLFQVSPADAKAVLSIKGSEPDAVEQMLGVVDASGALAKNMTCGTYVYHVLSENYYPSEGRIVLNDPSLTHREEIVLRPRFSSVTLTVDADADIYVNGEKKGSRSWTGQLNAGNYQVECRQASHRSSTQSIVVEENVSRIYTLTTPTPITGTLSVISSPLGATIQIDGKEYGTTPQNIQNLLIGNHTLTLTKEGFDATESPIVVKESETTEVSIVLSDMDATYEKARTFYEEKDYAKAVLLLEKLAQQGHADAQADLGYSYEYGNGVPKDLQKAVYWYEKAANQGQAGAQHNLGLCYYDGDGVTKDYEKAFSWIEKAANQGDPEAQVDLGWFYDNGYGVSKDYKKAFEWYEKAALQENAIAQYYLGKYYYNGYAGSQDYGKASYWYEKAANQGDTDAQNMLGWCYQNGEGVEKDLQKAVYWYEKAANQGDPAAQVDLGWCYQNGEGVEKDLQKAVYWYEKAANQGNSDAQINLGGCYDDGNGVQQDKKKAFYWYEKAANQGNTTAQTNVGVCYEYGEGVEKDLQKAAYWYEKAANQDDARAQTYLGICYMKGEGVPLDYQKGVYWYEKAANQGYAHAETNLGICYKNGKGVQQDLKKALYWLEKAANQGMQEAKDALNRLQSK